MTTVYTLAIKTLKLQGWRRQNSASFSCTQAIAAGTRERFTYYDSWEAVRDDEKVILFLLPSNSPLFAERAPACQVV